MSQVLIKVKLKGLLKARCEPELEQAYTLAAMLRKVDKSDIIREALRDYAPRALNQNTEVIHNAQR